MSKEDLLKIRSEVEGARFPHTMLMQVCNALVGMGTFSHPLDDKLGGLTYGQWQEEMTRRVTLAVLDYLIEEDTKIEQMADRELELLQAYAEYVEKLAEEAENWWLDSFEEWKRQKGIYPLP